MVHGCGGWEREQELVFIGELEPGQETKRCGVRPTGIFSKMIDRLRQSAGAAELFL